MCRGESFLFYLSYLCVFSVVFLRIEKWPKNPSTFFLPVKLCPLTWRVSRAPHSVAHPRSRSLLTMSALATLTTPIAVKAGKFARGTRVPQVRSLGPRFDSPREGLLRNRKRRGS